MTDAMALPPGVHPQDPSMPVHAALLDHGRPVPLDSASPDTPRGRAPWSTGNVDALPVNQRAASTWATGMVTVGASGIAKVVGRRPGRRRVVLWVPGSVVIGGTLTHPTPAGVMFGTDEGELQQQGSGGSPLNVGDYPVEIFAEGSVWAGLIPGQTAGYVCYLDEWNPAGGGLDV